MRFVTASVVLISLGGCAQYDEIRSANLAAAQQERVAKEEAICRDRGQPGSAAYEDCRKQMLEQRDKSAYRQEEVARQMLNESSLRPNGQ